MLNSQGERVLVYLANVDAIEPITFLNAEGELEEASSIEKLITGGWNMVVQKGRFEVDQLFVYCECDTILDPTIPLFAFLEGKRIKTKKLKGVVSQGVCFTIPEIINVIFDKLLGENREVEYEEFFAKQWELGDDWTELVGATKYDEYSPQKGGNNAVRMMPGDAKGKFPSFIPKTDEERVQNLAKELKYDYAGKKVIAREKLHGSSITIYTKVDKPHPDLPAVLDFGICSRNFDLKLSSEGNNYVLVGLPYLKELLDYCMNNHQSIALQGELLGPGINANPYNLSELTIRWFTAFDINEKYRYNDKELCELLSELDLESAGPEFNLCPFISLSELSGDMNELIPKADANSVLNPKYPREGMVIRAIDGSFSFKVISNKWLLKEKD